MLEQGATIWIRDKIHVQTAFVDIKCKYDNGSSYPIHQRVSWHLSWAPRVPQMDSGLFVSNRGAYCSSLPIQGVYWTLVGVIHFWKTPSGHLARFWETAGKAICLDRLWSLVFNVLTYAGVRIANVVFDAVGIRHSLSTSNKSSLSEVACQSLIVCLGAATI